MKDEAGWIGCRFSSRLTVSRLFVRVNECVDFSPSVPLYGQFYFLCTLHCLCCTLGHVIMREVTAGQRP